MQATFEYKGHTVEITEQPVGNFNATADGKYPGFLNACSFNQAEYYAKRFIDEEAK